MACRDFKDLLMAYLDGELEGEKKREFEKHLSACPECSSELEDFKRLKQITDEVTLAEPEDKIWQQYWGNVYNRVERTVGWILFSVSAILLLIYVSFKLIEQIIEDPTIGTLLKAGLLVLIAGLAVLFVSIVRERLYFWKTDRYKDVRR
jgi:predicted anti-sigma-YlaC factor YlaD